MIPVGLLIGFIIGYRLNKVKRRSEYDLQLICATISVVSWWSIIIKLLPLLAYNKPEWVVTDWFSPVIMFVFTVPPVLLLGFVFGGTVGFDIKHGRSKL